MDKTLDSKNKIKHERDGAVQRMMELWASAENIENMGEIVDEECVIR